MPFVENVLQYSSVAFVGMDKNSGKTEAMNYFLQKASKYNKSIALTSIGIDGEQKDQVTSTSKPEITICEGDIFLTSERFYQNRKIISEIIDLSSDSTALGRLVTAKALNKGKVLLAGPADTVTLKSHIDRLNAIGADIVVVDGALSRLSIASPTITQSLVLSTGAVVSHLIDDIVKKTSYQVDLIRIEDCETEFLNDMNNSKRGIYNITDKGLVDTEIDSVFTLKNNKSKLFEESKRIYFTGAINDSVIEFLTLQKFVDEIEIVVRDFTKVFVSPRVLAAFRRRGGRITVVNSSKLVAVCVNPISPLGYKVSSEDLCDRLSQTIGQDVYDVKKL